MPKVHPLRERGTWGNVARKNPPVEAESRITTTVVNLADCIAVCEINLRRFKQQQHDEVIRMLKAVFTPGEIFGVLQLWLQPAFRSACLAAGILSPQVLGKRFQHWPELTRIGSDEDGAIWTLTRE